MARRGHKGHYWVQEGTFSKEERGRGRPNFKLHVLMGHWGGAFSAQCHTMKIFIKF